MSTTSPSKTISSCDGDAIYGGAAILVHGDGAIGNQNIIIRNNRMSSNYQGDMDIQWVNGMTVAGNVITGAAQWPSTMPPSHRFLWRTAA